MIVSLKYVVFCINIYKSDWKMPSGSINELQLNSSGVLKVPIKDGDSIVMTSVGSGQALSLLSYSVQLYENLRVRDLFKMIAAYPELLIVVPGLHELSNKYEELPKIGCASLEVVSVWICRSTFYAYDEKDSISDKAIFLASEGQDLVMQDLSTFELSLESWLDCPLKKGMDTLLLSKGKEPALDLVFETQYTLFDLLLALRSTFISDK